jgi:protein-disulfide isomerase
MTLWHSNQSLPVGYPRQGFGRDSSALWFSRALLVAVVCLSFSVFAIGQGKTSRVPDPLAVIDGQPIYENQLPPEEQAQLHRMMQQVYAVKLRALHAVMDRKLVEAEAKKKGVSMDELLSEVNSKVEDPSDEQVSMYYHAHPSQFPQPLDEVRDKIRKGLKDLDTQNAQRIYVQDLLQQAVNSGELVVLLRPPRVEMTADPSRLRGDPKAPVTIVEFSDFSCSYCRSNEATINALLNKYQGKVKLGYRDFPLRQLHPQAQLAAEASRCAAEQGKYWEYHDLLFANANKQDRDGLIEDARTLKLDDKQFDACLSSGRYKNQIDQDIQLGTVNGVVATPGFFVNGTFLSGAQSAATFEKVIDEELSASSKKPPAN